MLDFSNKLKIFISLYNFQAIRWYRPRKPFWLGIAKSKMFVIKEPKILPEPENSEIVRLQNNYNTSLNSLLNFVKYENPLINAHRENESEDLVGGNRLKNLKKEIDESIFKNDLWNAKSAELRKERLRIFEKKVEDDRLSKILEVDNYEKEMIKRVEEIVSKEKLNCASYINLNNLNEEIEKCLNSEVEHNFAIDLNGNKYFGRDTFKL